MTTSPTSTTGEPPRPGAAEALAWLPARIETAIACGTEGWEHLLADRRPTVVVGAGGSHPAAEYLARLLRDQGTPARATYPLDRGWPEPRLVAVSYSGSSPDIAEVITRARREGTEQVTLITGADQPALADRADQVLWHRRRHASGGSQEMERGFISFASTLAPCVAAATAAYGADAVSTALSSSHQRGPRSVLAATDPPTTDPTPSPRAAPSGVLEVFASGWAWPAALDLESKWTEAALGTVRLHEAKNFSHGRYQSVLGPPDISPPTSPRRFVLLQCGRDDYSTHLEALLERYGELLVIEAGPDWSGGLAALAAIQPLAVEVGASYGLDVSRPSINPDGPAIYSWIH